MMVIDQPPPPVSTIGRLAATHRESLRRQPTLVRTATVLVLAALPMIAMIPFDVRTFNGVDVWLKPAKFAVSFAIYALTLAWATEFVDPARRANRAMRFVVVGTVITAGFELAVITVRAALAQGSHFNTGSALDSMWYSLMGVGAVTLISTAGVLAWQVARSSVLAAGAQRIGWVTGLAIGSIVGGVTGGYMSSQPSGHWVGGSTSDANGISILGWSTTGGDLRVAHFLGLHAMIVLPLVGWAASRWMSPRSARWATSISAVTWVGIVVAAFVTSTAGNPVL